MLVDYHVHTDFSHDCQVPMAQQCARAIELGIQQIAFTDHFNNNRLDVDVGFYHADRYFAELERCRAQFPSLRILAGVEIGEPHRHWARVQPVLDRFPYDIVLGSVHRVGNTSIFDPIYYYARTAARAYGDYFAELRLMIAHGGFDVLAHVDLPKRVGFGIYQGFEIADYEDELRAVWAACLTHKIVPEINTKGMRLRVRQPHPSPLALRWYAEQGGCDLTIGSDAHTLDSLGQDNATLIDVARAVLKLRFCLYQQRRVVMTY